MTSAGDSPAFDISAEHDSVYGTNTADTHWASRACWPGG